MSGISAYLASAFRNIAASGLRLRLTALVLAVTIIVLITTTIFINKMAVSLIERSPREQMTAANSSLKAAVSSWLACHENAISYISSLPDIVSMKPERQKTLITKMTDAYPHMYLVSIVDLNGINTARSDDETPKNYSDRKWFKQIQTGGDIAFQSLIGKTSHLPALVVSKPIRNADDTLVGVAMFAIDIHGLSQQVRALRIGETGYAYLVDPDDHVVAHPDAENSKNLITMSKYPPVERARLGLSGEYSFSDNHGESWVSNLSNLGNGWVVIVQQKSSEFYAEQKSFQRMALGSLFSAVLVMMLTTWWIVRKGLSPIERLTAELKEAKEKAEVVNLSKSIFLSNMSHEIRTPLNAILGYSQILKNDKTLTPTQQNALSTINRSGEHLLALVNDILEISKIEAGRATINVAPFDLKSLFRDLEMMFSIRTNAKQLALHMDIQEDMPAIFKGDEGKLRQIYINLLGNAVKFTSAGSVTLKVTSTPRGNGMFTIHSEVRDTGPGIAPEEMDKLFHHFEQASAGIRSGGGTSLGLAISHQFVKMMGSDITVESKVGQGACFAFSIDLEEAEEAMVDTHLTNQRIVGIRMKDKTRYRVLVTDDKADNRNILSHMLRAVGFEVEEAANGQEAVDKYLNAPFDLILMDMRMPVMDGFEAIRRIKAHERDHASLDKTPIIAVTASTLDLDRQQIMETGTDGYVGKPFRENELFEAIAKVTTIEFLHEDASLPDETPPSVADTSKIAALAAKLPAELIQRLRQAITSADLDRVLELCDEIETHDGTLAAIARRMARNFEYENLQNLLSSGNHHETD